MVGDGCMYCIFHSLVTVVIFHRLCIIVYSIVIFDSDGMYCISFFIQVYNVLFVM